MADAGELEPGTMIGPYRVDRRLGGGGMGTVYAAEEPTIRKRVAIKVMREALSDSSELLQRFEREARAANDVRHPGIVDVFAFGKLPDGRPYLVMSLLEGRSLREEIAARGALPPPEAWAIAREIADALAAAHEAGIVHRDLKPDNVILERFPNAPDRPPRPRICDFGIAKIEAGEDDAPAVAITKTGASMGTPAYMAPEQWWGEGVEARTDQYGFGAMLFEMLAGRPPFTSLEAPKLLTQHLNAPPPSLAERGIEVSPAVEALVARTLTKTAAERFPTMRALLEEGDRAFGGAFSSTGSLVSAGPAVPAITAPRSTPSEERAAKSATHEARRADPIATAPTVALGASASATTTAVWRCRALQAAALAVGLAGVALVGYAGEDRYHYNEWYKIAGFGSQFALLTFVAAVVVNARAASRRAATGTATLGPFWLALMPALTGAMGTYSGWFPITRKLATIAETARFGLYCEGVYEASASRFIGFALGAIALLGVVSLAGVTVPASATTTLTASIGLRSREKLAGAVGLSLLGAVAIAAHAPSGALVAGAAALALAIGAAMPARDARTAVARELEQSAAGLLAVLLAVGVGFTRLNAREAILWPESPTRAARAAEILAASGEREATTMVALASIAVFVTIEIVRVRRLALGSGFPRPGLGAITLALFVLAAGVTEQRLHAWFGAAGEELRTSLAPQFALFARLDPPSGDALSAAEHKPHKAPGLQIARDVVALNGDAKAKLAALETPAIVDDLARAIGKAVAEAAKTSEGGAPDLAISIDREVRWAAVQRLLAVAYSVGGVRHVELLFTRGAAPTLKVNGPPEAGYVLASDFVALPAELAEAGVVPDPDRPFGAIAPELIAAGARGPLSIDVRPKKP